MVARWEAYCLMWAALSAGVCLGEDGWRPAAGPLMTRWAQEVRPGSVLAEYPRPQMVRQGWRNLNGLWEYAITDREASGPQKYAGRIMVPFAVESALSGVMKRVGVEQRLWYRRTFELEAGWRDKRVLLHFGAVDWEAKVYVNGQDVGQHRGGYDAFSFDITEALREGAAQEIVVGVWDPTDAGGQARGKQVVEPKGIWYTPTTGIWQTVWLEAVEKVYIEKLWIVPDVDAGEVSIKVDAAHARAQHVARSPSGDKGQQPTVGYSFAAVVLDQDGKEIASGEAGFNEALVLQIAEPQLWWPANPYLYGLKIRLKESAEIAIVRKGWFGKSSRSIVRDERTIDEVTSYFGMRKVEVGPGPASVTRMLLNGEAVFQVGPLDQGFWPDGLYTAPTDEALRYDIEMTKKLGFNMARKHVKVEPARWYYWCDKLGLLVWQDMPSGYNRTSEDKEQFERELAALVRGLCNHPSIVMWVVFNETWGQYDTERLTAWVKQADPTRLVNNVSGWTDKGVGDVHDIHDYPGPSSPALEAKRAVVLGEFGGLGLKVGGHMWKQEGWGYQEMEGRDELLVRYRDLWRQTWQLNQQAGLSAAIYTQTTDVEIETNGLMTYDRAVCKMEPAEAARAAQGYVPPVLVSGEQVFIETADVALASANGKGEVYYTLDGSEPTKDSMKYERPIHLSETATIKARCFWDGGRQSEVVEFSIRREEPPEAVISEGGP